MELRSRPRLGQATRPFDYGECNPKTLASRQFFFVISGEATLEIQHKKIVLRPQQGVSVPPKVPHRLLNEAKHDLSFIVVSAPMSHGDRVLVG